MIYENPDDRLLFTKSPADVERMRAYHDALLSLRSLPDPAEIAKWLDAIQAAAIYGASSRGGLHVTHPWCSDKPLIRSLRLLGLVDMRDTHLTVMGMKVRRKIREGNA